MKGEFLIIRDFFAPLAAGARRFRPHRRCGADQGFRGHQDMLIEGVHFLKTDPMDLVARKLVRVNVSDLAAKGAKPIGYFLACAWPSGVKRTAIEDFARGLREDQTRYKIALYGGDTTRHAAAAGALTLSATFFGAAPRSGMVRRDRAAAGDDLSCRARSAMPALDWLRCRSSKFSAADRDYLSGRYRLPEPRVTLGGALPGLANASIDVSDGLLADAGHLAERAGLRVEIDAASIPLSDATARWLARQEDKNAGYGRIASSGDDYEILFAAPPTRRRAVEMAAALSNAGCAHRDLRQGARIRLLDAAGAEIEVSAAGFDHFAA